MLQFVTKSDKELLKLVKSTDLKHILSQMPNCYCPKERDKLIKMKEILDGGR